MKPFYLILVCLLPLAGITQTKLYFSYDPAGNQVLRGAVCVNCGRIMTEAIVNDTVLNSGDTKAILAESLTASPNPVTNRLRVQWVYDEANPLQSLQLYSANGHLLYRQQIKPSAGQTELDFSSYLSGLYFLTGINANGQSTTIKIIRQ